MRAWKRERKIKERKFQNKNTEVQKVKNRIKGRDRVTNRIKGERRRKKIPKHMMEKIPGKTIEPADFKILKYIGH